MGRAMPRAETGNAGPRRKLRKPCQMSKIVHYNPIHKWNRNQLPSTLPGFPRNPMHPLSDDIAHYLQRIFRHCLLTGSIHDVPNNPSPIPSMKLRTGLVAELMLIGRDLAEAVRNRGVWHYHTVTLIALIPESRQLLYVDGILPK